LLSFGVAIDARANTDTTKKIRETRTIVVGYREAAMPFSYVDAQGKPIGYTVELCQAAVERMKAKLGLKELAIKWQLVTFDNRISMVSNGTVDLECGCTSNTRERQKVVAFGPTFFVSRFSIAVGAQSGITGLAQAAGKPVAVLAGSSGEAAVRGFQKSRGVTFKEAPSRDPQQAFDALATGKASAVVLDQILLAGFIRDSGKPGAFRVVDEPLGAEAYGPMLRANDPAFKALVMDTFGEVMKSGEALRLYEKWFTRPVPLKALNFNLPASAELKALFHKPSAEAL
jgi:glutamate/aspartate transport system substrate-binding protein